MKLLKPLQIRAVLTLCAVMWAGCDFFPFWEETTSHSSPPLEGMVRIAALGRQTLLGSTSKWAKTEEESPRLTAKFTADFFMDKTEVTQGHYDLLMGRNPATPAFGLDPRDPVYNVTWYDAILFCNARSKQNNLDTVYSYTSVTRDNSGRAYAVDGLTIRYEVYGYRLPTEAEWEFAARAGATTEFLWGDVVDSTQAGKIAWFAANSGGKVHAVGQLAPNSVGLSDMMGNVMEWVNDWKGPYEALSVESFLGTRNPGLIPERVVKGGAFSYDSRYLRFSGRSANYPTLSSAATEYVGFRCVLGTIPKGQYLSGGGVFLAMPAVAVYPASIRAFFGHDQVKLVFVNTTSARRTLCYVNFLQSPVTVLEFLDDSTVFAPVISPDGEWVAYGDLDEGDARGGSVKIRRLAPGSTIFTLPVSSAAIPRWWVDPVSADTFLVYANSARDNLEPAWNSDETYRIRIAGGVASGSPVKIVSGGGYHDGISNDGSRLAGGYRRLHLRDVASASDRILFTGPQNGKPVADSSQVCNVSLHPQFKTTPQLLLLDFGYGGKSTVVGRPYGLHEILFRIDTAGNVASWYNAPPGFPGWQDVEWSNHADYAVGVGESQSQDYPAVIGLNLKNTATVTIATGTTLRQPGLWIRRGAVSVAPGSEGLSDSLGKYYDPATGQVLLESSARMKLLWGSRFETEVVFLGSSHFTNGIWPPAFSHFTALNLGYAAAGLLGFNNLMTHYLLPHFSKLKAVVIEVHPGYFNLEKGDASWSNNMGQSKGYVYDSTHGFWNDGVPPLLDSIMHAFVSPITQVYRDTLGTIFYPPPTSLWDTTVAAMVVQKEWTANDPVPAQSVAYLNSMVQVLRSRQIHAILVIVPQSHVYKRSTYYGKYGPPWKLAAPLVQEVHDLCTGTPYCTFYDANEFGNHDYPDSLFENSDHLTNGGALQLSHRLDSLIWKAVGAP